MAIQVKSKVEYGRITISHNQNNVPRETLESPLNFDNLSSDELELCKLSDNSKRKMRKRCSALMLKQLAKYKHAVNKEKAIKENTAFITLTLSDWQKDDDRYIKSKMLNTFLTHLRKSFAGISYIWKAEKQKNGNIHFHILVDRYISWQWIRAKWNAIQKRHGYTKRYNKEFGGHDPNSIDVQGLRHVKNCMSYMFKYISKELDGQAIEGRIWGCSNDLIGKGDIEVLLDSEFLEILEMSTNCGDIKKYVNDHCTVYIFSELSPFETYRPEAFEWILSCIAHE